MAVRASHGRVERIAELIRRELAEIFLRRVKDPRLQECVISQVRLSNDLRVAWVSLSIYDASESDIRKALEKANGFIRRELSGRIELRHSPELRFEIDHGPERLMDMTLILRSLNLNPEDTDAEPDSEA